MFWIKFALVIIFAAVIGWAGFRAYSFLNARLLDTDTWLGIAFYTLAMIVTGIGILTLGPLALIWTYEYLKF